jgi:hypothetical protein
MYPTVQNTAQEIQMMCSGFFLRHARSTVAAAALAIAALSSGAPVALAKDAYPPGWNVTSDVPPSTASTWIGGYNTNLPYWADHERPDGRIPSRYAPDQCHWNWCKTATQKPTMFTAEQSK